LRRYPAAPPVGGLRGHLHVVQDLEIRADSAAYDGVVVDDQDPDRAGFAASRSGTAC
jgi:hypothetical protein